MKDSLFQFLSRLQEDNLLNRFLSANDFVQLDGYLQMRGYATEETVFREGESSEFFAFLAAGRIKLTKQVALGQKPVLMGLLNPGALLGEMALVDGATRAVTATAMNDVQLVVFDRAHYQRLLAEQPELAGRVLQLLLNSVGHRLRMSYQRLAQML